MTIHPFAGVLAESPRQVSDRIGRVDRFGNDALMPKLAGVPSDQLSVACLVAVELKAGNCRDQRLKNRLALDEQQAGDAAAVEMQEIEREIDEPNPA
jgi:hypothetical protein